MKLKQYRKYAIFLFCYSFFILTIISLLNCTSKDPNTKESTHSKQRMAIQHQTNERLEPAEAKKFIAKRAQEVINALKQKDMNALSILVHPKKGVRFSPYTYVEKESDIVISSNKLEKILDDTTRYQWGFYDATGKPIHLTFSEYFKQFVYDHDFAKPEKMGYQEIFGRGNTRNNISSIYPHSICVELYFSGFEPRYGGMDWASLRLIFEKFENKWYLVGIAHDQWTS